ncbi:MAG: tyrosine-type recombinase/integrase [Steroidobacteraceae bacterium]|nr:tyrosine-type recombinase/integrase [Steroidobacteraceae bacterium]
MRKLLPSRAALREQDDPSQNVGSIDDYIRALSAARPLTANTIAAYASDLRMFERHVARANKTTLTASPADIEAFISEPQKGRARRAASAARRLTTVRNYYRYLVNVGLARYNPAEALARPRVQRQDSDVLSEKELLALLNAADLSTSTGCRDRVMLELVSSKGLSASEIIGLRLTDVDLLRGRLTVRKSEYSTRLLHLEPRTLISLKAWLKERETFVGNHLGCDVLFPSNRRRAMTRQAFWFVVRRAGRRAGLQRPMGPRVLRATQRMLQKAKRARMVGTLKVVPTQVVR